MRDTLRQNLQYVYRTARVLISSISKIDELFVRLKVF